MSEVSQPFIGDTAYKLPLEYRHAGDHVYGHFDKKGLEVFIYQQGGKNTFPNLPENTMMADIDFKPNGKWVADTANTSSNMLSGLQALSLFFDAIDAQELPAPEYLHGTTNKEVSLLAKRLGFNVTKIEPKIGKTRYEVFGERDVVREKLSQLQNPDRDTGVIKMLTRRTVQAPRT